MKAYRLPISVSFSLEVPCCRFVQRHGNDGELIAAYNRLEGYLNREVEVVGEQRLNLIDDVAPVGLERIRGVVISMLEEQPDTNVDNAVEDEFQAWIVDCLATATEARAERAVISVLEDAVIEDEILGVSRTGRPS